MSIRPLVSAGTLLGIGLGGFIDGILFHQLLQWHSMLSQVRPPITVVNLEINMFWDGMFHAATWLMTAAGIAMLFHAGRQRDVAWSGRVLLGAMILGWGLFNLVEGVIDHHLLALHHVRHDQHQALADLLFLASGVVFIVLGALLVRGGRAARGRSPPVARQSDRPAAV